MDNDKKNKSVAKDEDSELQSLITNAMKNKKIIESSLNDKKSETNTKSNAEAGKAMAQSAAKNRNMKTDTPSGSNSAVKKPANSSGNRQNTAKNPNANKNAHSKTATLPAMSTNAAKKADNAVKAGGTDKADSLNGGAEKNTLKKKMDSSKKVKIAVIVVVAVLVAVVLLVFGLFFHYTNLFDRNTSEAENVGKAPVDSSDIVNESNTVDPAQKEKDLKEQLKNMSKKISSSDVTNILLIGEDIRDTASSSRGNTDVMLIISINSKKKTITMTSLMRDMWVYLSKYNENNRLNSAYWHGGCSYLESTIEDYFGISIDRYVRVNFLQFIKVVDTIGGLDLTITKEEAEGMKAPMAEQNKYQKLKSGTDYIKMTKAKQTLHLNGNQVLAYARLRYVGNADFERTERQRIVLNKVIKKSKSLSFLKFDALANAVFPKVKTDLTDGEFASLLLNAFSYMDYTVNELRLPLDGYFSNEVINGNQVLCPDYTACAAILKNLVYGTAKTAAKAQEQYEKGTGISSSSSAAEADTTNATTAATDANGNTVQNYAQAQ